MAHGAYYWVPLEQVETITMNVPKAPRDLLWVPARLEEPVLPMAFTRFRAGWQWPGASTILKSRATDETGSKFMSRLLSDEVLTRVQKLAPIAQDVGLSMAQFAVAWVLQNRNVSSAIIGASRPLGG